MAQGPVPSCLPCVQAADNPTASGLFAERLRTLRDKDGFGAVLFSSHVRKVRRGRGAQAEPGLEVSQLLLGLRKWSPGREKAGRGAGHPGGA